MNGDTNKCSLLQINTRKEDLDGCGGCGVLKWVVGVEYTRNEQWDTGEKAWKCSGFGVGSGHSYLWTTHSLRPGAGQSTGKASFLRTLLFRHTYTH